MSIIKRNNYKKLFLIHLFQKYPNMSFEVCEANCLIRIKQLCSNEGNVEEVN